MPAPTEAAMSELKILQKSETLHEARWWEAEAGGNLATASGPATAGRVHCYLCPRHCHIGEGQAGFCFIRANQGGKLYSLGYAHPAALQIDPIEKKPLNHFLPGTRVFSMGTAGCNMGCFFCQNWDISKSRADQVRSAHIPPEDVVLLAIRNGCPSIAFTYNEPTIWGEYVIDICHAAHERGINTVMVSNGYITREAFHDIYDHVDAANIDLKAFTEDFYGKITLTHLQPVLETLKWLKNETNVWFELTNLMIPTLNDGPTKPASCPNGCWSISVRTCLCISRRFIRISNCRISRARLPKLCIAARKIALDAGLALCLRRKYLQRWRRTRHARRAATLLIQRSWHSVEKNRLTPDGRCPKCGLAIPGRWTNPHGKTPAKIVARAQKLADSKYSDLNL